MSFMASAWQIIFAETDGFLPAGGYVTEAG
jgi:hypothetical protein